MSILFLQLTMLLIVATILLMQLATLESFMLSNRGWTLKTTKLSMLGMIVGVLRPFSANVSL